MIQRGNVILHQSWGLTLNTVVRQDDEALMKKELDAIMASLSLPAAPAEPEKAAAPAPAPEAEAPPAAPQ